MVVIIHPTFCVLNGTIIFFISIILYFLVSFKNVIHIFKFLIVYKFYFVEVEVKSESYSIRNVVALFQKLYFFIYKMGL